LAPIFSHQIQAAGGVEIYNSLRRDWSHITSATALAIDLYSASVLERDTVGCFLALQEIGLDPKNMACPPIDLQSSEHPTQSASEKALTTDEGDFQICKPMPKVCLT
jgi:hypothetical protein